MDAWVEKGARLHKNARAYTAQLSPENVHNILVIRHAALGDMLQTRPFLIELKKLFPKALITLNLISHYQYSAPLDLVDNVHITTGNDQKHLSKTTQWKSLFIPGCFDILFDLACTSRSYITSIFTKATLKMSYPYRSFNFPFHVCIHRSDFRFEAENLLEFLTYFGHIHTRPLNYGLDFLPLKKRNKNVLCFFGSSDPSRCYPLSSWEKLLPLLATEFPEHKFIVVDGVQAQEKYGDFVLSLAKKNILSQKNGTLKELEQELSQSFALLSNDTGVRHLALATHTPTVGFFSKTCPGRNMPSYESHHLALLANNGTHKQADLTFDKIALFFKNILSAL
jgi:ADP-heptose:LPS heptosyltransferase